MCALARGRIGGLSRIGRWAAWAVALATAAACGPAVTMARTGPPLRPLKGNVTILNEAPGARALELGVVSADGLSANEATLLKAMQDEVALAGGNAMMPIREREDAEHREGASLHRGGASYFNVDAKRREVTARAYRLLKDGESEASLAWLPPQDRVAAFHLSFGTRTLAWDSFGGQELVGDGSYYPSYVSPVHDVAVISLGGDWWPLAHFGVGCTGTGEFGSGDSLVEGLELAVQAKARWLAKSGRIAVTLEPAFGRGLSDPSAALAAQATQFAKYPGFHIAYGKAARYRLGAGLAVVWRIRDEIALRLDGELSGWTMEVQSGGETAECSGVDDPTCKKSFTGSRNATGVSRTLGLGVVWQPAWTSD